MAYKDKDKQKEANRLAQRRRRIKLKGMTPGITMVEGMTYEPESVIPDVIPECSGAIPDGTTQIEAVRAVHKSIHKHWTGPLTKEKQTSRKGFNE